MGTESEVFTTLFKSTIYVFPFVAQGLNEIVMLTMVTMKITDFATFCYSRARMQVESSFTLTDEWQQEPDAESDESPHPRIICIERLGGLSKSYHRKAA